MKSTWQVQEAKNKFSQVLDQAENEPQVITRHGRKAGVLMSYAEYRKRINPSKRTIRGLYAGAPKFETDELDFQRDRDTGRDIRL
jgi:prevent-host-death family protein